MNPVTKLDFLTSAASDEETDDLSMADLTLLLFGHSAFQILYAGCILGLFSYLHQSGEVPKQVIKNYLRLPERSARTLLFGLTALNLIRKRRDEYRNSRIVEALFENGEWQVFYDTVRLEAEVIYAGQGDFVESLREDRNIGLRRTPGSGPDLYHRLPENPAMQRVFYDYMSSWSRFSSQFLIEKYDFSRINRLLDAGGGDGTIATAIASAFPNTRISILELPGNGDLARRRVSETGLNDRIEVIEGSIFEPLPRGYDAFLFAHQLVIWPLDKCTALLRSAYDALPPGGQALIFSSISSDDEDGPTMAALDSVYFISVPAQGGMIWAWKDYDRCLRAAGFDRVDCYPCRSWTPHGLIVGTKVG
jgi:ubiquinone/menaquinone biosynthesis C-methylase UbiE